MNNRSTDPHLIEIKETQQSILKTLSVHDERFDGLTDIITRVAHAVEGTQAELTSHKNWEEGYHKQEQQKAAERDAKHDALLDDLSLYFKAKSTSKNVGEFAGWLAKLGIVGIVIMWAWTNAIQPLMKKLGVF